MQLMIESKLQLGLPKWQSIIIYARVFEEFHAIHIQRVACSSIVRVGEPKGLCPSRVVTVRLRPGPRAKQRNNYCN